MKSKRLVGALLTVGLMLAAATGTMDALAKPPVSDPPVTKKAISWSLSGISWGQSPKQVAEQIDKLLDDDYRPRYQGLQPGIKTAAIDAQLAEEKAAFRRGRVDFGKIPTGLDATPLRGEYTYNNKEALYNLVRQGEVTHLFFIQERLWKIIEEKKLNDARLGKSYQDAVVKLSSNFGIPGRVTTAGSTSGAVEVDWRDATTHLRAIQRGETSMGLAYEDNAALANLSTLRANKPAAANGIDPDVAAALRGRPTDPGPPTKDKK